ncbi:hypothetical protein [Brevundimonas diminuta]|uniref:hypothetical protein n=1 Tax=Brevundimonas diminuta TaxID=293 RepID=UPI0011787236|nr:hypothetical protein [Brevundimonas diminuta]
MASLLVGGSSLVVAVVALVVAGIALRNSDRNSSAATLLAIMEAFRQGWERFEEPDPAKRIYHFHSLMNLFEVGCAIHQDRSVHGASKKLLEAYMRDTLTMIEGNEGARAEIVKMRNNPEVFEYLKLFLKTIRRNGPTHPIEPLVNKDVPEAPSVTETTPSHAPSGVAGTAVTES